ncbi:MAG: glycoside hydrolase family 16 protein [Mariniblastus sp.]
MATPSLFEIAALPNLACGNIMQKLLSFGSFSTVIFLSVFLPDRVEGQPAPRSGYEFAWADEFNGSELDTSLWTAANTNVPTNNSLQDYLPEQVTVNGGNLVITSENLASRGLQYRSGLVQSNTLQKHGRWDIRAKLPTSKGMWPAIWLLADAPWPSQGEIDIMENRGDQPELTSSAFHYGTNPPFSHSFLTQDQTSVHNSNNVNYHSGFHTYSVEWDPTQIRFYVDNVQHWTVRDSEVDGFLTNKVGDMRLIINTAIGGTFLDDPDGSTVWPQKFEIDYVHAFTKSSSPPILTFDNGDFEAQDGSLAEWRKFGDSMNNVSSGNEHIETGTESLKLFGQFNGETNYSGIEQGISVTKGDRLMASVSALTAVGDSISGTENLVELKIDYYSELYGEFGTAQYISSDVITLIDGNSINDAWLQQELFSTAPAGAVEARLAIVFQQRGDAGGAVYIDNVSFASVPEPGQFAILVLIGATGFLRRKRA